MRRIDTAASDGGRYFSLAELGEQQKVAALPYAIRVLLESAMRNCDGVAVTEADVGTILNWGGGESGGRAQEIPFKPARVIMQDMSGGPCLMDLEAMRRCVSDLGRDPSGVNPLVPVDLVIDHSVIADNAGSRAALKLNMALEFERNEERFGLFKWASGAFENVQVVPPGTGIIHQVNLEYLARGVIDDKGLVYPDSMVGTDSHSTMVNGLGVLGWGVGGIEALSVMLGQPIVMVLPEVVGVELKSSMQKGVMATDLVLQVVQVLREEGVVGKFVEFFGEGIESLSLADRATVANMAPEYGATMGYFPPDEVTMAYYAATGRPSETIDLARRYLRENQLFAGATDAHEVVYSKVLAVDLSTVQPCVSGPKRPHDRVALSGLKTDFERCMAADNNGFKGFGRGPGWREDGVGDVEGGMDDGTIVVAAITSCTNTSNPYVMIGAGLVARKAVAHGLSVSADIKTSLSPGSQVVGDYLHRSGLQSDLDDLGFHVTGFGCMTCVGNSGELLDRATAAATEPAEGTPPPVLAAVLSGNRNFESRVHPLVSAAYLASPPLVVAFALAGRVDIDLTTEPLGISTKTNEPVFLRDVWPNLEEIRAVEASVIEASRCRELYDVALRGDEAWQALETSSGALFAYDEESTYIQPPPFLEGVPLELPSQEDGTGCKRFEGIRCLLLLGDSVTTDHISPVSRIAPDSHSGQHLTGLGVEQRSFGSYGTRRGNAAVMVKGTFANAKLANALASKTGPFTKHLPTDEEMFIADASELYRSEGTPLMVIAGAEYGQGSARDWAAKGTALLGVKFLLTKGYERIHRSNLVGMGVVPLQFPAGTDAQSLGLDGTEHFAVTIPADVRPGQDGIVVEVDRKDGTPPFAFTVKLRLDTLVEIDFFRHGGVMPYVMRSLV